jgi:lysophospholipase L1-like esterase
MRSRTRRAWILAVVGYVLAVHLALLFVLMRTDFWDRMIRRAGLSGAHEMSINRRTYHLMHTILEDIDRKLRAGPIVLLGDSFVEKIPSGPIGSTALNLGIGGLSARELAEEIGRYPSLGRAAAIVLAIGTNDLCGEDADDEEMARRLGLVAGRLPSNVPLLWSSIAPTASASAGGRCGISPERIQSANATIGRLCGARVGCVYSNGFSRLADSQGRLAPQFDAGDGVHVNAAGYALWEAQLAADLSRALRRSSAP